MYLHCNERVKSNVNGFLNLIFISIFIKNFQIDKKTGEKSQTRPRFVKQDQIAIVRFSADDVICMETFKDHPQLGRFTLRDEGTFRSTLFKGRG
jgi:translation elongation factor EF-1alpha